LLILFHEILIDIRFVICIHEKSFIVLLERVKEISPVKFRTGYKSENLFQARERFVKFSASDNGEMSDIIFLERFTESNCVKYPKTDISDIEFVANERLVSFVKFFKFDNVFRFVNPLSGKMSDRVFPERSKNVNLDKPLNGEISVMLLFGKFIDFKALK